MFDSAAQRPCTITANDQMINHCGLTSFYLEALSRERARLLGADVMPPTATLRKTTCSA